MGWLPVGLSLMATLLSALSYTGIPGQGYEVGLKCFMMAGAIWLILPIVHLLVIPIYRGLGITSIYEYLGLRYDQRMRWLASGIFVVWRLLWLGGVLYAPCKALAIATGLAVPMPMLLITLGLVSTAYTYLGGMRAVIWTDVIQAGIMLGGVLLIVVTVWGQLDGGQDRVWKVTQALGRDAVTADNLGPHQVKRDDQRFDWQDHWNPWAVLANFALAMLSFYIADQITAQRFLTTSGVRAAQGSFLLNCVSVTAMMSALMYVGMCMLAFYFDNPQEMNPKWVANLSDATSRRSLTYGDLDAASEKRSTPLLEWTEEITADNAAQLVADGRLIHPNRKEPFTDVADVLTSDGRAVDVQQLAIRLPKRGTVDHGELVINSKAVDELMPRYIANHLPMGVAGLLLAALLAASMSSMDSGLNSISTLAITDFVRGSPQLTQKLGILLRVSPDDSEAVELAAGRWLVLIIGVAATFFAMLISFIGDIFAIMVGVINTFGGPLAAVILLGMITRRSNSISAMVALLGGMWFSVWFFATNKYPQLAFLWPFAQVHVTWTIAFGFPLTMLIGLVGGLFETPKSKQELRGLVAGFGQLGKREQPQRSEVEIPLFDDEQRQRWK